MWTYIPYYTKRRRVQQFLQIATAHYLCRTLASLKETVFNVLLA